MTMFWLFNKNSVKRMIALSYPIIKWNYPLVFTNFQARSSEIWGVGRKPTRASQSWNDCTCAGGLEIGNGKHNSMEESPPSEQQSNILCASGPQLPRPRHAHALPGIVSWLDKPDLAIVAKLQEGLPFKYTNKGRRNTEWKLKLQKYDFQLWK